MVRWLATLLAFASVLLALMRTARADQPGPHTVPVAVLSFESEDAEEQADALTGALRSRIRASQGWSLNETSQSLGMLTAALKCTVKPLLLECQARIGDQIKSERYIWGYVQKGPTGQVTAEIHLYQKNKPDTTFKETYSDNLKDPSEDTLRKIAQRIVDKLGGSALGVVVVRAGDLNGEVVVDGEKRVPLHNGAARIEVAGGGHSIEISAPGIPTSKRNVLVTAGRETVIDMNVGPAPGQTAPEKPFPTRKVLGGTLMGVGVVFGAIAVQQFVFYLQLQDRGDERIGETVGGQKVVKPGEKACKPGDNQTSYDQDLCNIHRRSQLASGLAAGFGAAGALALGAGAYLLFTEGGSEKSGAANKPRVIPQVGETNGLVVVGAF